MSGYVKMTVLLLVLPAAAVPAGLEARSAGLQSPGSRYNYYPGSRYTSSVHYADPACRSSYQSSYSYSSGKRQTVIVRNYENRCNSVSYRNTRSTGQARVAVIRPGGTAKNKSYGYRGRYSSRQKIVVYRSSPGNRGATIGTKKKSR